MSTRCSRCLVFLLIFLSSGCAYVNVSVMHPVTPLKEKVIEGKGRPKILLLDISGFISEKERSDRLNLQKRPSMVAHIRESLQKAGKDDRIAGIILKINSPGGTVTASDIIHHELMNFRKENEIPVYSCITGLGTSGAYYIASSSDKVFAHPNAITGSIGVIALKFNVEALMTKLGIDEETIKSGDKKDIFSPFRPLTDEERDILQQVIDEFHNRFVAVVFEKRKEVMTMEHLETLADGRIYTAASALELHLIDQVGYMDEAVQDMKKSLGIEHARIISYRRSGEHAGSIYSSSPSREASLIELLGDYTGGHSPLPGVAFLYLWNP